ncbi:exosortase-associated EpsI family protein [Pedosphaera parvula]|nr:exosortase-associated EpsI family protein [Pedosphaera parvula]
MGLMAATAGVLSWYKTAQKLGAPGVKTTPIAGSHRLNIQLPELVLDYTSEAVPTDQGLLDYMPQDTSFVQRHYVSQDGFHTILNVVLMGTDRTSIHKPQFCLRGQGWDIDGGKSTETTIRMTRPYAYDLPVMKLIASRTFSEKGRSFTKQGVYVYWFVADNDLTAQHRTRMWHMSMNLLRTGVLERWAYVTCFAVCDPGEEEATFERMKKFIAASTPQFQLAAGPHAATAELPQTASR